MKTRILAVLLAALFAFTACTSQQKLDSDDEFAVEGDAGSDSASSGDDLALDSSTSDSSSGDELSLDEEAAKPAEATAESNDNKPVSQQADSDLALENELNSLDNGAQANKAQAATESGELTLDETPVADQKSAAAVPPPADDLSLPEEVNLDAPSVSATPQVAQNIVTGTEPPAPVVSDAIPAPLMSPSDSPAPINSVLYKGNANGGTVAIGSTQPLNFTTRFNATTNQFIVEVQNSTIAKKLKRSLNTKDMASSIGSVDIYQKPGSSVARFVVQLRAGSPEPIVQPEGNSLLIIGAAAPGMAPKPQVATPPPALVADAPPEPLDLAKTTQDLKDVEKLDEGLGLDPKSTDSNKSNSSTSTMKSTVMYSPDVKKTDEDDRYARNPGITTTGLLSYENLEDFLMSNTKFYGKKISIETQAMNVIDALKFISEESGVNMVFDDSVLASNQTVNLKLLDVPWDQAFVLILKSKKLAYKRQGNVLRIATSADIQKEEAEAIALIELRKKPDPIVVKRFFVAYGDVSDIKTKVEEYLSNLEAVKTTPAAAAVGAAAAVQTQKPRVIIDVQNNSMIVAATEENLKHIEQIVSALDTQPKQILIEGKFIETSESFSRGLGVTWTSDPASVAAKPSKGTFSSAPGLNTNSQLSLGATFGSLDFFGALTATLNLGERTGEVKTLSSPRVTVISNQSATIGQNSTIQTPGKTTISNGVVTTEQNEKQLGTTLTVTPVATNEGTVRLKLNIVRTVPVAGSATSVSSRNATTELYVRSGATAVVGGVYTSDEQAEEGGITGIRKIPILGSLFEAKQTTKSRTELMIFVTPTIMKPL